MVVLALLLSVAVERTVMCSRLAGTYHVAAVVGTEVDVCKQGCTGAALTDASR